MFDFTHRRAQLLLCAGLLVASVAVEAAESARNPTLPQRQAQAAQDEAKVCKRVVPTGSRIARRYCLTRRQWEEMREDGQKAARDAYALESQYGYDASPSGS